MIYLGDEREAACKGGCRTEKLQRPRRPRSYKDLGDQAEKDSQLESGCSGKGPSQNLDCVWEIALGRPKQASINEWP